MVGSFLFMKQITTREIRKMIKSKLLIVFKDSLAGTPYNLRYKVYINGIKVSENKIEKGKDIVSYQIIWMNGELRLEGNSVVIPEKPSNKVEIKVISAGGSEKKVGEHELKRKDTTLTLVSPWTRIPLAGGGKLEGDFFEVEYNVKRKDKNLFAKVIIKDIPRKIVLTALKYRGSTKWGKGVEKISERKALVPNYASQGLYMGKPTVVKKEVTQKFTYPQGTWKCSTFVYDILHEIGINVPWLSHGWIPELSPPLAGEWADKNLKALQKDWSSNTSPLPGDIGTYAADYANATGHVGIILTKGVCISAGADKIEVNDAGFRIQSGTFNADDKYDFSNFRRYKHKVIKK